MHKSDHIIEIFLQPGEFYFGDQLTRIRTVLGSCVSLVFWHPQRRVGGMCHYMLPGRQRNLGNELDGRYADEAIELALAEIKACNTRPADYKVKMFGGGNMFPGFTSNRGRQVGAQNVLAARTLIKKYRFECISEHVEGFGHRNIIFDVASGDVFVRHCSLSRSCENDASR